VSLTRTVHRTAALAEFASQIGYDDIPATTISHAKLCVLDALGCGLFGSTLEWSAVVVETMRAVGGRGDSAIWGTAESASADAAALANGTAVHAFELDDLHKTAIFHPGGVTLPALLGMTDSGFDVSGREFLTALVAGYEVGVRVGFAVGLGLMRRGWHNNGVIGVFSAAAAVGRLLRLDPHRMEHALGTAASQAGGLMAAQYASMVKRFHAGRAAQSGLYAAALADRGFTGVEDVLGDGYGTFMSTFADEYRPERLTEGLGTQWETEKVGFKWYPACGSSHTSIDAALSLRTEHGIQAEDVASCRVTCSTATREHVGWPYRPGSVTTAQMNLPFAVAVALSSGDVTVADFSKERIRDPGLVDLASKVVVEVDAAIDARGPTHRHEIRMCIELRDGRSVATVVEHARGSEHFPLSTDEVVLKFERLATAVVGRDTVARLQREIRDVPEMSSVQPLTTLLRVR
jgi:aconitate decarboxylase